MFIVEDDPKSVIAESYKTLRTNIQYSSLDKKLQTIVVTSSEPGEGKTTTACNLALSFAQSSKKTLLIDCDLRKPTVHKQFKISNLVGLSDVLIGKEEVKNILVNYNDFLDVLSSGHISPNPSEMLSSNAMSNLLNELKEEYEVIILDSAPLLAVTDAQLLSVKADGTILVVKADKTKKDCVVQAKGLLEKVNANLLGLVLNKVERASRKYYYYYGEDGEKRKKKNK